MEWTRAGLGGPRAFFAAAAFAGDIFVAGGASALNGTLLRDVWRSTNGARSAWALVAVLPAGRAGAAGSAGRHGTAQGRPETGQSTLDQIVIGTCLNGRNCCVFTDIARHDDERQVCAFRTDDAQSFSARETRKMVVGDHRVPGAVGERRQQSLCIFDSDRMRIEMLSAQ